MNVLLNILGIFIFFINRFFGRKDESTPFSLKIWLSENWQEALTTIFLNAALMLLLINAINNGSIVTLLMKLPDWLTLLGIPGISFALGAGLSWTLYELFKSKKDSIKG